MRITLICFSFLIALPLHADEPQKLPLAADEPPPPPPMDRLSSTPGVPDAAFLAMRDQQVSLLLRGGARVNGRLIAVQPDGVTVIRLEDNAVIVVPRVEITILQAAPSAAPPPAYAREFAAPLPPAIAPNIDRHIGINFGGGPAVLAIDADYRPFYGFLSAGLALPLFTTEHMGAVTLGLGGSWRLRPSSNWQFDLFGHATVGWGITDSSYAYDPNTGGYTYTRTSGVYGAIGVGIGFHYTLPSGFTVGFHIPIIGGAFSGPVHDAPTSGGYYYLSAAISFPLATIGYRF